MRSIAGWLLAYSSKFFEMTELSAKAGVGKETADNYIAALKAMYLFDEIKPWTKSDYSKLGRRSKRFAENLAPAGFTGIVLYSGSQTLRFGEGFYAVPLAALGL